MAQENKRNNRSFWAQDGLQPPYSLEAEQAVLGSVLMDSSCISRVADILRPEHFYLPEHQIVYRVMLEKMMASQVIDFVTVLEAVKADEFFAGEEGKQYLFKMAQIVPAISNIEHYARIIRNKFDARALMKAAREIMENAADPDTDPKWLMESAAQKIYDISQGRQSGGLTPLNECLASSYEMLSKLTSPERERYVGIPTGLPTLDAITTGLNRANLIIVGARPGMGKTSFALNLARNVALKQNRKVAFFNLEMSKEEMVNRLLSAEARVSGKKLRTGMLSTDEWMRIADAAGVLCKIPLYLDDTAAITVPEIKARLMREGDVSFVVIDYLGLMKSAEKAENRVQEVSKITRDLKVMAKELDIPVMACAQLSRGPEKQATNHRPGLSDLRDSGSIEQDADQVLFLYREEYYKGQTDDPTNVETGTSEVIVAKNRHGDLGTVKMAFAGEFTQFSELEVHQNG